MGPGGGRGVSSGDSDFVVVANRLPIDMERLPDGTTEWKRSPGGLVTALEPLLRGGAGPGSAGRAYPTATRTRSSRTTCSCTRCGCPPTTWPQYYEGFSNATLWPLYHDVIVKPIYHREWWERYVEVNRRFAEATSRAAATARRYGSRTTSCSWCRRCCGCCGPTSPSDSSCTFRSRRSSCSCRCRGAPRSSRACSAPTWSASTFPAARRTS